MNSRIRSFSALFLFSGLLVAATMAGCARPQLERPQVIHYFSDGQKAMYRATSVLDNYGVSQEIPLADGLTIQNLSLGYGRDGSHAYKSGQALADSDPISFEVITAHYAKDKRHVYFDTTIMPEADAQTFTFVSFSGRQWLGDEGYGKDVNNCYIDSFVLECSELDGIADIAKFEALRRNLQLTAATTPAWEQLLKQNNTVVVDQEKNEQAAVTDIDSNADAVATDQNRKPVPVETKGDKPTEVVEENETENVVEKTGLSPATSVQTDSAGGALSVAENPDAIQSESVTTGLQSLKPGKIFLYYAASNPMFPVETWVYEGTADGLYRFSVHIRGKLGKTLVTLNEKAQLPEGIVPASVIELFFSFPCLEQAGDCTFETFNPFDRWDLDGVDISSNLQTVKVYNEIKGEIWNSRRDYQDGRQSILEFVRDKYGMPRLLKIKNNEYDTLYFQKPL